MFKKNRRDSKKKKASVNEKNRDNQKCFRCCNTTHLADQCQYKEAICHFCKKRGHLRKMCFKEKKQLHQIEEKSNTVEDLLKIEESTVDKSRSKLLYDFLIDG